MLGPAAFAFALGAHSFSFKITIRPEAGPAAVAPVRHKLFDPHAIRQITAEQAGRFVLRTAVRMIAGHATVSPSIARYSGYAVKPSLKDFRIPAESQPAETRPAFEAPPSASICLQQADTPIASRICGR